MQNWMRLYLFADVLCYIQRVCIKFWSKVFSRIFIVTKRKYVKAENRNGFKGSECLMSMRDDHKGDKNCLTWSTLCEIFLIVRKGPNNMFKHAPIDGEYILIFRHHWHLGKYSLLNSKLVPGFFAKQGKLFSHHIFSTLRSSVTKSQVISSNKILV